VHPYARTRILMGTTDVSERLTPEPHVMETLKGHLLISSGGLFDPNFRHTVVLVGQHDSDGAVGVVINRPLDVAVDEAVPPLAPLVPDDEVLYEGGPVEPETPVLLAELAEPHLPDVPVIGRIGFLTGEVAADLAWKVVQARVYSGYSGWAPGQLEAELEQDSWIIEPARPEDVFDDDPETLWSRVLRRKGPEYHHIARMPFDPSMN